MICRLIDFPLLVLKLLMFKSCVIISISKIEFFNFSETERVKQNQKKLETIPNLLSQSLFKQFQQIRIFFCFFVFLTENINQIKKIWKPFKTS